MALGSFLHPCYLFSLSTNVVVTSDTKYKIWLLWCLYIIRVTINLTGNKPDEVGVNSDG